jgi:hypothetical protein
VKPSETDSKFLTVNCERFEYKGFRIGLLLRYSKTNGWRKRDGKSIVVSLYPRYKSETNCDILTEIRNLYVSDFESTHGP